MDTPKLIIKPITKTSWEIDLKHSDVGERLIGHIRASANSFVSVINKHEDLHDTWEEATSRFADHCFKKIEPQTTTADRFSLLEID